MVTVKILGVSGSPRHGNTEILVQEALSGAEELPNVKTEFISLVDKKIAGGCKACFNCLKKPSSDLLCRGPGLKDDVNDILRKMIEADGIILGTPTYWGSVTSQLKCVIDRVQSVESAGMLLRNKVGGAITVACNRQGGQEGAVLDILKFYLISDMIPVSVGPERPEEGLVGFYGVQGQQGFPHRVASWLPGGKSACRQDEMGMKAARNLGKRVAEFAKIVKAGLAAMSDVELAWPKGPISPWKEE